MLSSCSTKACSGCARRSLCVALLHEHGTGCYVAVNRKYMSCWQSCALWRTGPHLLEKLVGCDIQASFLCREAAGQGRGTRDEGGQGKCISSRRSITVV